MRRGEQEGCVCTKEEKASRRDLSNVQWDRTGADADADDASGDGIEGPWTVPVLNLIRAKWKFMYRILQITISSPVTKLDTARDVMEWDRAGNEDG